jgi:hypothetical protein
MSIIDELLSDVLIPPMAKVRQVFPRPVLRNVVEVVQREMRKPGLLDKIKPGDSVAVTVGSRGIANLPVIIREIVDSLKKAGAQPFIVPAMGSHGGASAEGQTEVLSGLGITPESIGAPIRATMEVINLSEEGQSPVYFDRNAFAAQHTVVVGRVKIHTSFRGPYESGIVKMIAIGLGKQKGAELCHSLGLEKMSAQIERMARIAIAKTNILCGVALLENGYDETCRIVSIPAGQILDAEPSLLVEARGYMPQVYLNHIDVLIVDEMGKNISGTGLDPNIIERFTTPSIPDTDKFQRIVIRDLTPESHGNFNGSGLADMCTRRLFEKMDFAATYPNPLTSRVAGSVKIPMVLENDRQAIQAAIKTCLNIDPANVRMVRIKNTLHLEDIQISAALMKEACSHPHIEVLEHAAPLLFDTQGDLQK